MSKFIYNRDPSSKTQIVPMQSEGTFMPDVLLFLGDLNYRINGFKPSIMQAMGKDRYDLLINSDQLNLER